MQVLLLSTLPKENQQAQNVINELTEKRAVSETIYTEELTIHGCVGCNNCWLKTPGTCTIRDDYEKLLIKFLQVDQVVFLTEAKLGFVSYKMKNLVDRILPLATMYLKFEDGQMRHFARYQKDLRMGLLYLGEADQDFLHDWMDRVMLNMHGKSLGAYPLEQREELCHALSRN